MTSPANPLVQPKTVGLVLPNGAPVLGSTVPRLWTPPLRELTPETSYGFDVIDFARDELGHPMDEWQAWVLIHMGELLPDGRPRFRKVLILVARQNGKTELCVVLSLYWMFVDKVDLVLGTSTKLEYAKDSWRKAVKLAKKAPNLFGQEEILHKDAVRKTNGDVTFWRADEEERILEDGSRYRIAAANEEGGRSLTIDRLIMDELRQHHDYSAYDAAEPATSAVQDAQIVMMSNAGNDRSEVLNDERDAALTFINSGVGDYRLGLFEYSCEDDAKPNDPIQLAKANPNFNRRLDGEALVLEAENAMRKGGKKLVGFKTEKMCIRVRVSDPAVDIEKWRDCNIPGSLDAYRDRLGLAFDVSEDERHITAVAAALTETKQVRIEVVKAWTDLDDTLGSFEDDFRELVKRVRPVELGWFPSGPSAIYSATMLGYEVDGEGNWVRRGTAPSWIPRGVNLRPLRGEAVAACMGFAEQVRNFKILHSDDPILNEHVPGSDKLYVGDGWRVARKGMGQCDGYYASAGAVFLARTLTPRVGKPRLVVPS